MKLRVLMLVAAAVLLLSGTWFTALASDWDDMSWDAADSDWDWDAESSWTAPKALSVRPQATIPEYPGAAISTYSETEEPVKGTLRSVHTTEDSAIRVAGYYQWMLGLAPVEIRPYHYVIQMRDDATGLYTIITIRPEPGVSTIGGWASMDAAGAMITVIDADTPHESLAAGVGSLGPMDASGFGGMDFSSAFGNGEMDPSMLFGLMMMAMMMMGGEEGLEWGGGSDSWSTDGSEEMSFDWEWSTDSWSEEGDTYTDDGSTWSWSSSPSDSNGSGWGPWDSNGSSWDSGDDSDSSWDSSSDSSSSSSWDDDGSWDWEWSDDWEWEVEW